MAKTEVHKLQPSIKINAAVLMQSKKQVITTVH